MDHTLPHEQLSLVGIRVLRRNCQSSRCQGRWWALAFLPLLLLAPLTNVHGAQDEHNRRFAVELIVIDGDLRLLNEDDLQQRHRQGLLDRIASALGFLGLLAREAQQASGQRDPRTLQDIEALRRDFAAGKLDATSNRLQRLKRAYPLDARTFLPVQSTPERLARGQEIYHDACRACHIAPDTARDNPARSLIRDAATMPEEEFVARLLAGVRGDARTGLENPFPDEDLRSLLVWLRHSDPTVR